MGNWQLEVCKMAMYMAFPVGMFHIFNQPSYFEEWVTKKKRELYPPENIDTRKLVEDAARELRLQRDAKMLQALDEFEKNNKE